METYDFAKKLMSDERRECQDPTMTIKNIGIRKGMVVADLGCGPCYFTIPISARVGSEGKVYAVDSNRRMLVHLRADVKRQGSVSRVIKIVETDVTATGIPSKSVDVALFANVLHNLEDSSAFLNEVRRIVKEKSTIVDIDWRKSQNEHGPPTEIRLSKRQARSILAQNGLKVMRKIDVGPFHYGLVCRQS